MQKRTFENLILDGKDLFLEGDITIKGNFEIKGANLIVSGNLTILGKNGVEIENGEIIVSGELTINTINFNINGGNISCDLLYCQNINISDGDIWTNTDLDAKDNITSDGDIEVGGNSFVSDVTCLNYLVTGDNNSESINASHDIYILGNNDSCDLTAREILIDGDCNTNAFPITAHHFVCSGDLYCKELFIE